MSFVDKLLERNDELIKKTDNLLSDMIDHDCKIEAVSIPRPRTVSDSLTSISMLDSNILNESTDIKLPKEINLIYQTYFVNLKPELSIEEKKICILQWNEFKNKYPDHSYRERVALVASIIHQ